MQLEDGSLPLLVPMCEVADRLAVQIGGRYLQADQGGRGVLLGGVPGVPRGRVTVIGGGIVGTASIRTAHDLGAKGRGLDVDQRRLSHLYDIYINTLYSNLVNLERAVLDADIVIGSMIVDVAVDQGGCVETISPTSHSDPTYVTSGVIHYGVPNMPGAVPYTSTLALNNAILAYLFKLAEHGADGALNQHPPLAKGVHCYRGEMVHHGVATAQDRTASEAPWSRASDG